MNEAGKNKHPAAVNNRTVKQNQQQNDQQQHPNYQTQSSFERQLGLSNITALSESAAGDRHSLPRVSSSSSAAASSKNAFALETIRRELQRVQNGSGPRQVISMSNGGIQKEQFKSNSFNDLHQGYRDATAAIDQRFFNIIMSLPYGFDEVQYIFVITKYKLYVNFYYKK